MSSTELNMRIIRGWFLFLNVSITTDRFYTLIVRELVTALIAYMTQLKIIAGKIAKMSRYES